MKQKAVILIGGGLMAAEMCKEIRRRNLGIILVDGDSNCFCRIHYNTKKFIQVDVYDAKHVAHEISVLIASAEFEILAVLTVGTDAGPTVARVAQDFPSVKSISYKVATAVKNKGAMRGMLMQSFPQYGVIDSLPGQASPQYAISGSESAINWDRFPCVIKALDQSGSRGFRVCRNREQFEDEMGWRNNPVLIEDFIPAKDIFPAWRKYGFDTSEVAIDCLIENGKLHLVNAALRMFWLDLPGIEAGHINPYHPGREIKELAIQAAQKLGVTWGPFKLDLKLGNEGWHILEAATRLSGGFDHMRSCPKATGKNITKALLDLHLGLPIDPVDIETQQEGYVCVFAPRYAPGPIAGFEILGQDKLSEAELIVLEEEDIRRLTSNQNRPAFVISDRKPNIDDALQEAMEFASTVAALKPIAEIGEGQWTNRVTPHFNHWS